MDELAYSIDGQNEHFGTPINPAADKRLPGGSSSGSAVAVASRLRDCDFGIGTDSAGSAAASAAYCGVYGFRPSHRDGFHGDVKILPRRSIPSDGLPKAQKH